MKMNVVVAALLLPRCDQSLPFHGFEESEPAIQYHSNIQGIKADNAPVLGRSKVSSLSGGLVKRRIIRMGLYGLNSRPSMLTVNGATMAIDYYYPNGASLPPADVQTVSPPHVAFFDEMRELGNETVYSTIMSTVVEVAPQSTIGVSIRRFSTVLMPPSLTKSQIDVIPRVMSRNGRSVRKFIEGKR